MSKIKLTGSNSGYVEISSAADAGNLTLALPTAGTTLLSNAGNVFTGITTFTGVNITDDVTFTGASYNVLWDKSDNQLEFGDNAKLSFGASSDLQIYHDGSHSIIEDTGTGNLFLRSDSVISIRGTTIALKNAANTETLLHCVENGAVSLYHDNALKLQTTQTGAVVTGICTATSFSGSGEGLTRTTQLSHRNKVINGAMLISQRGTSFTSIGGNTQQYTLDRFKLQTNNFDQAVATISQDSSAPVGFSKSLKIQCTTAETSVEAGEHARLMYDGEAFDFTDIGFGTSSAKKVTLSFWVKSNLTGTWGLNFWRGDANRSNLRTYTINSANTWEHKVITLSADTSGGGVNSDNGYGFRINWGLATGADLATSHPLDVWHTFQQQHFYPYDARNTNFYSSTSNNFYLTGVQLEVGEQATPFEHKKFSDELKDCQRYYQQIEGHSDMVCAGPGRSNGTTHAPFTIPLSVPLRASPTVNACAWAVFTSNNQSNSASQTPSVTKWDAYNNVLTCQLAGLSGMTNGRALNVFIHSSNTFTMDAEL
tara:strand:+ start:45 stop:1661 length:1617 start_codon:yes stop_codon:yes gene_type:complete